MAQYAKYPFVGSTILYMCVCVCVCVCARAHACMQLLSFEPLRCLDSDEGGGLEDSSEEGCCWVCQGVIEDPGDLFYPCNCKLHKKCIKQWIEKVRMIRLIILYCKTLGEK